MKEINITIADKEYTVQLAITDEEKEKGLQGQESLDDQKGMLFVNELPETSTYWMQDCSLNLDIIFIDEYWEVLQVDKAELNTEDIHECDNVKYILELNQNSGVKIGDEVDLLELEEEDEIEDEEDSEQSTMLIIGPKGKIQGELKGGERIFSRPNTKTLIRMAKKGYKSKDEKDFKRLGRKIFEYINTQDTNEPEYVDIES